MRFLMMVMNQFTSHLEETSVISFLKRRKVHRYLCQTQTIWISFFPTFSYMRFHLYSSDVHNVIVIITSSLKRFQSLITPISSDVLASFITFYYIYITFFWSFFKDLLPKSSNSPLLLYITYVIMTYDVLFLMKVNVTIHFYYC